MADASVRGSVGIITRARFNSSLTCRESVPSGSINGRITTNTNTNRGRTSYDFRSVSPARINTRRNGRTNNVFADFGRVTLVNRSNGNVTNNARLTLAARRSPSGNQSASLTINRPGRDSLRVSGNLRNGGVFVGRNVSCQLLLR